MIILKGQVPHTTHSYTKHSHKKKTSRKRKQKKAKYTSIKQRKAILALSCLIIYILFHPLKKHKANPRFWGSKYPKIFPLQGLQGKQRLWRHRWVVAILLYSGRYRPSDKGRGAPGHSDPEIIRIKFFGPLGAASVWSKNKRGAQASQAPPLDLPLLYTKWAVDHSPTPISQNVICLVRWHKQTSLRS